MFKSLWKRIFKKRKYYITHEGETNFKLLDTNFRLLKVFDKLEYLEKYLKHKL